MLNIFTKLRFKFNPYIRYKAFTLGNVSCINQFKRETPIIVSITSTEENFYDLEITLYSLMNQSVLPDRVVLWLSDEYSLSELPYGITRYVKNGLEIRFIKDLGEYNKIIYSLKEFSDSIIVTASDCIYYEKDWLKKLYHSYISNPEDIHAHIVNRVIYDVKASEPALTKNRFLFENEESARFDNFAIGFGGILYPPNCFRKEVFREDIYANLQNNSDLWLWLVSLLSDRKTRLVKSHYKKLACVNLLKFLRLDFYKNNNYQELITYLMPFYGQNIIHKLKI